MFLFPRETYVKALNEKIGNKKVKVITGMRRSGKTYLLMDLFYDEIRRKKIPEDHIIRLKISENKYRILRDINVIGEYLNKVVDNDGQTYFVLIDDLDLIFTGEIQKNEGKLAEYVNKLKYLSETLPIELIFAGKFMENEKNHLIEIYSEDIDIINVYPLSFREYYENCGKDKFSSYVDYSYYGGLPESVNCVSKAEKLAQLMELIYISDIVYNYDLKNSDNLKELTTILASNTGSLINAEKIRKAYLDSGYVGISAPTIKKYFRYLENTNVISKAFRLALKRSEYINTPNKYYFTDIGLCNAVSTFYNLNQGSIMENIVYNYLVQNDYIVDIGSLEINRTKNCKNYREYLNIDFVVTKDDERQYIQCHYGSFDDPEVSEKMAVMLRIEDNYDKIVLVSDTIESFVTNRGIIVKSVYDFLLGY